MSLQVPGRGGKHSPPPECRRQRRAHTVSPPPPRTVQQPQACSISWSFIMAAPSTQHKIIVGAWSRRQALPTRVSEAETSTHLDSTSSPRTVQQPQACSNSRSLMAAPSTQNTLQVPGRGGKHSTLECRRKRRACTIIECLCASHGRTVRAGSRKLAPSVRASWQLCRRKIHRSFACAWSRRQALSTRVPEAETSTHLESLCASLLYQSELHGGSVVAAHIAGVLSRRERWRVAREISGPQG